MNNEILKGARAITKKFGRRKEVKIQSTTKGLMMNNAELVKLYKKEGFGVHIVSKNFPVASPLGLGTTYKKGWALALGKEGKSVRMNVLHQHEISNALNTLAGQL